MACISNTSPDMMLRRWAFLAELDSSPPANPPEITWILPRAAGVELGLADKVVVAAPSLVLLKPRNRKMPTSDQILNFFPRLDAVIC